MAHQPQINSASTGQPSAAGFRPPGFWLLLVVAWLLSGLPLAVSAQSSVTALEQRWQSPEASLSGRGVSWGDFDADGDLDFAIGYTNAGFRVYRNESPPDRPLSNFVLVFNQQPAQNNAALAWGDADGDGDLDLAVANNGQPIQVYPNSGDPATPLTASNVWTAPFVEGSVGVAWGDADGDGDLDLAVANWYGQRSRVYANISTRTAIDFTPAWQPSLGAYTERVAWLDIDLDTDLDLIASNSNWQANQVFLNCTRGSTSACGTSVSFNLTLAPVWLSDEKERSIGVGVGDLDGDKDPDLIFANVERPVRIYLNCKNQPPLSCGPGDLFTRSAAWSSAIENTVALAIGDYNGDGRADLFFGNYGQPSSLYRNVTPTSGAPVFELAWNSPERTFSWDATWGYLPDEGPPSRVPAFLLVANLSGKPGVIYENMLRPILKPINVTVDSRPASGATVLRRPQNGAGSFVPLTDAEGKVLASRNGLIPYEGPLAVGDQLIGLHTNDAPASLLANIPVTASLTIPANGVLTSTLTIRGAGTIKDLDVNNLIVSTDSISDLEVSLVSPRGTRAQLFRGECAGQKKEIELRVSLDDEAAEALASRSGAGCPFVEGLSYRPYNPLSRFDGEPISGTWTLVVRDFRPANGTMGRLKRWGLSHKKIFRQLATSAAPSVNGLAAYTVDNIVEGRTITLPITVTDRTRANQLLLFDLDLSLEWDARNDPRYLAQLTYDLTRTSELLYDWSDGQVALGEVAIYHDRERWDSADIRVYATNLLRPHSAIGGVSPAPISETIQFGDPLSATILSYQRGQVNIAASWNRYGDQTGVLGEDWPRALAHELGHHLLYLNDNYLGFEQGALTTVDSCRGAMSDPYSDTESEFHPAAGWLPSCAQTLSNDLSGRSDWETILQRYGMLREPAAFGQQPGPGNLPLAVTAITSPLSLANNTTLSAPVFRLVDRASGGRIIPQQNARAYLLRKPAFGASNVLSNTIVALTELGRPSLNSVEARGARPGDVLCYYEPAPSSAATASLTTRLGCMDVRKGFDRLELDLVENWQPDVTVTPLAANRLEVKVPINGTQALTSSALVAQYFPLDTPLISTTLPITVSLQRAPGQDWYAGTLQLDSPVAEAFVHVFAPDTTSRPLLGTMVRLSPLQTPEAAAETQDALIQVASQCYCRRRDGDGDCVRWSSGCAPVDTYSGQVGVYVEFPSATPEAVYLLQSARALPSAPAWTVPVGQIYRLTTSAGARALDQAALNIGYLELDVPAGAEGGVTIYYLDEQDCQARGLPAQQCWQPLPASRRDFTRNEIAAPLRGSGLYALMTAIQPGTGWNLIAYPWKGSRTISEALNVDLNAQGAYATVYGYVVSDTLDPWRIYDHELESSGLGWINDLTTLEYGRGYWINVVTPTVSGARTADASAAVPNPPVTFYSRQETLRQALGGLPQAGSPVAAYVGMREAPCAATTVRRLPDGTLGFAIDVPADDGGALSGCGTPGRSVSFRVGGQLLAVRGGSWITGRPRELLPRDYAFPDEGRLFFPLTLANAYDYPSVPLYP